MEFEIYGKDIRITEQLRGHIERRLCFALERFARRIRRVRVSLGDLNGPRGGVDKRCRVTVVLVSSTVIVIEDRDSSIYAAIARVADKAGVCIGRRLERHKGGGKYMKISRLLSQEQESCRSGPASSDREKTMKTPRKKVLVADCNEEVLIALERMLEDAGFDTTTVWTARDALRLVDSQVFDLVLVNEYLPDADCEDVLKALRKRGAQMACIVMQPSAPEITDFTGLQALGARDIVCKYAYRHIVEVVSERLACDKTTSLVA